MRRLAQLWLVVTVVSAPVVARHATSLCATSVETSRETLFVHKQALRRAASRNTALRPQDAAPAAGRPDIGNIAIVEDGGGAVQRQNEFNLDLKTLQFLPSRFPTGSYSFNVTDQGYDAAAAAAGIPLAALDDDDTRDFDLPFAFPFFGTTYSQVWVNSDGNVTFTAGDNASTDRSLGRMTSGPPRISPLFDDLDPAVTSGGVRFFADSSRVVISWVSVPEWQASGIGARQTFQVKLYPDGRIEFSYSGIIASSAVVGIAPGNLKGGTTLVDFRNDPSGLYGGAVAERFGDSLDVDIVTVAQQFYQTHEDAYDYLVIFNSMDIPAMPSALAYESTVRSNGIGYGVPPIDYGALYGSSSRLHAVLNMGPLSDYPADPNALVPLRAPQGDTPLSAISHETGHLFLAFASIRDPNDPTAFPMLGYQHAHWNFAFNSEASFLEGERILDRGSSVSPEFLTTDTVQQYAPLDQYLMGFRPSTQVPDTFLVTGVPAYFSQLHPLKNFAFDGVRENISVSDVIQAMGRRTPDYTVAQRHFRFAFILLVAHGAQPTSSDLAKIDTFRQQFEPFYGQASSGNGSADTALKHSLELSLSPAAGVVTGASTTATVTVASAPAGDLTVQLQAPNGNASVPASVKIAAGSTSAQFAVAGVRAGVEEITATPADSTYETAYARVQVGDASVLTLVAVSGDQQVSTSGAPLPDPIVVRLTDANNLSYAGARIVATPSAGGTVNPTAAVTDAQGMASFRWTPGSSTANQLQLAAEAIPVVDLTLSAGTAVPMASEVVNSASFAPGIAAGALESIMGVNLASGETGSAAYPWPPALAGTSVLLNGTPLPLLYVSDTQINFYVPQESPQGTATLTVVSPSGIRTNRTVSIAGYLPGIFADGIVLAGTNTNAATTALHAGDTIDIFCTGLGPVTDTLQTAATPTVFIGAVPVQPTFSGLDSGVPGYYRVEVQVPDGLTAGPQSVILSVNLTHSNEVSIMVQ